MHRNAALTPTNIIRRLMTHGFVAKKKGLADLESFDLMKYVLVSPEFVISKRCTRYPSPQTNAHMATKYPAARVPTAAVATAMILYFRFNVTIITSYQPPGTIVYIRMISYTCEYMFCYNSSETAAAAASADRPGVYHTSHALLDAV